MLDQKNTQLQRDARKNEDARIQAEDELRGSQQVAEGSRALSPPARAPPLRPHGVEYRGALSHTARTNTWQEVAQLRLDLETRAAATSSVNTLTQIYRSQLSESEEEKQRWIQEVEARDAAVGEMRRQVTDAWHSRRMTRWGGFLPSRPSIGGQAASGAAVATWHATRVRANTQTRAIPHNARARAHATRNVQA